MTILEFCNPMRIVKVFGLMALTLTATMVPASMRAAPLRESASPKDPPAPNDAAMPAEGDDQDESPPAAPAPTLELWDGSSGRSAGKSAGPLVMDGLPARDTCGTTVSASCRWSTAPLPGRRAPHAGARLIGHDAHAPPLS